MPTPNLKSEHSRGQSDRSLRKAIHAVAPKQREVLIRFYVLAESAREIARQMGMSEAEVLRVKREGKSKFTLLCA